MVPKKRVPRREAGVCPRRAGEVGTGGIPVLSLGPTPSVSVEL